MSLVLVELRENKLRLQVGHQEAQERQIFLRIRRKKKNEDMNMEGGVGRILQREKEKVMSSFWAHLVYLLILIRLNFLNFYCMVILFFSHKVTSVANS